MPTREPSNREILTNVRDLNVTVQDIATAIKDLSKQVAKNTTELHDVKETVDFMKENFVTRDELNEVREEMKNGFRRVENKIVDHVDGFIGLYKKQDAELVALSHRMTRHESMNHGL